MILLSLFNFFLFFLVNTTMNSLIFSSFSSFSCFPLSFLNLSGSTDTILQPGLGKLRGKQEKEEKEKKIKEFIVALTKKKGKI